MYQLSCLYHKMHDFSLSIRTIASPGRPVNYDTNSASPGSILARQLLRVKAKSLTFQQLSIARYSCIQLSEQGRQWRERKCQIFETVTKRDSNPGSLDCESGILPLSYRETTHHRCSVPFVCVCTVDIYIYIRFM